MLKIKKNTKSYKSMAKPKPKSKLQMLSEKTRELRLANWEKVAHLREQVQNPSNSPDYLAGYHNGLLTMDMEVQLAAVTERAMKPE